MRRSVFIAVIVACLAFYAGPVLIGQAPSPVQQGPIVNAPGTSPEAGPNVPSQPAVAVTEVKSPAAPAHYTDQALWALMMSFLIQYLKKSSWFGWITPASSARLKAQFGFLVALLTATGIHFAVSGNFLDDKGAQFTVTGLSLTALKDVLWQWASQQAWYRAVVKEPSEVTLVQGGQQ